MNRHFIVSPYDICFAQTFTIDTFTTELIIRTIVMALIPRHSLS
jgi:hypothetical protein